MKDQEVKKIHDLISDARYALKAIDLQTPPHMPGEPYLLPMAVLIHLMRSSRPNVKKLNAPVVLGAETIKKPSPKTGEDPVQKARRSPRMPFLPGGAPPPASTPAKTQKKLPKLPSISRTSKDASKKPARKR